MLLNNMNIFMKIIFKTYCSLGYGNIKNKAKQLSNQTANQMQDLIEMEKSVIQTLTKISTPFCYGFQNSSHCTGVHIAV